MDFATMLASHTQGHEAVEIPAPMRARRVLDHYADLAKKHTFKPGDLVVLKPGVDFWKHPNPGEPCCVLEVLNDAPVSPSRGNAEDGMKTDLRLCVVTSCGCLAVNLYASAFFEPYTGPVEPGGAEEVNT